MSLSKRTRDGFRNFSRRFNPDKPPASSVEAVGNIPSIQVNGRTDVHPNSRVSAISNGTVSTGTPTSNGTKRSSGAATTTTANSSITPGSPYHLRPPTLHRKHSTLMASTPDFQLPDLPWLCGTWHIAYSTLPIWHDKRNVRIQYTRIAANKLEDVVTYQKTGTREVHKVHGVDTAKRDGRYSWRGKGLLKVASSKWEVLGWGGGGPAGKEEWVVIYFNRTMFTPAGIDLYSRSEKGLSAATVAKLRKGLGRVEEHLTGGKEEVGRAEGNFAKLVGQIYQVKMDGGRDADEILVESAERIRG